MSKEAKTFPRAKNPPAISELCKALRILAKKKLRGHDSEIVLAAVQELRRIEKVRRDLTFLGDELAEIERLHERALASYPGETGETDLVMCTMALNSVCDFLSVLVPCHNLTLLRDGLQVLLADRATPAMFHPLNRPKGRPVDAPSIMAAKGILAGMMHVQQLAGMSRENAAKWIIKNISPTLATRISGKPLTPRMIEEWLDRYGGAFPGNNPGGKSYQVWSRGEPVSPAKSRNITEKIARIFPVRKPR
jgi:hypothetical protein